ncbi:tetratricopeptide repeat protein [Lentisphaera profundi]|uniref:Tetratricopeptide repeat protein n=1 Tax=Lentisphaera profundi TaxID=1658616 RepID=A0ABY7VWV2_9BACT|nr:tetratricopeptide repeat protein [Lentisphaera profundi]WDE97209.1 tetratricopeptide repeat protein [Lentisphaera profundi]
MKYLFYLFSLSLLALEPSVPREQSRQYQDIIELIAKEPKKALDKLQAMEPSRSPVFDYLQGSLYLDQKNQKLAISSFLTAIKKLPEFTRAHKALAHIYLQENNNTLALKHLSAVIRQAAADLNTWKNIAYIHMSLENWQAAWFAFENVRLFDPENKEINKYFLDIRMHQENYADALIIAREILDKNPQNRNVWLSYISCLNQVDKSEEALMNFVLFDQLFELSDSEKMNLASLYYSQGNYIAAAKHYAQIKGDMATDATLKQAYALMSIQKYDQAAVVLAKLDKLKFENKENYYQIYAQVKMNLGKQEEALKLYQEALKYNADNAITLISIAQLAEQLKDYELAIEYYTRSAKHNDYRLNSLMRRSRIYLIQKKWSLAQADAQALLDSNIDKNSQAFAQHILQSIPK